MKIAGIQFACSPDKDKNVEKALRIMDLAVNEGAHMICFQELFNLFWFPVTQDPGMFALAEEIASPTIELMRGRAREAEVVIVLPFFEKRGARYFNSAVVIDAGGEVVGVYRKVHVPAIPLWEEKFYFSPGDSGFPVFRTRYATIGVQLSWDNLYPEGARILGLKGADLLFAPTACAFKSQPLWQGVITGNAVANSLFVMRVNRAGNDQALDFYGASFCVNPEGELVSGPTGTSDGILLADIDLAYLSEIRREWPIMRERRPDVYGEILANQPLLGYPLDGARH